MISRHYYYVSEYFITLIKYGVFNISNNLEFHIKTPRLIMMKHSKCNFIIQNNICIDIKMEILYSHNCFSFLWLLKLFFTLRHTEIEL